MKGMVLVGSTASIMLHSISKLICIGKESYRQPTPGVPSRKTWRRPLWSATLIVQRFCAHQVGYIFSSRNGLLPPIKGNGKLL